MQVPFPPDGEVPRWSADVAYDVDNRFVGYRQAMSVDAFGSCNLQLDVSGLPDLTVGERCRMATRGWPPFRSTVTLRR